MLKAPHHRVKRQAPVERLPFNLYPKRGGYCLLLGLLPSN